MSLKMIAINLKELRVHPKMEIPLYSALILCQTHLWNTKGDILKNVSKVLFAFDTHTHTAQNIFFTFNRRKR